MEKKTINFAVAVFLTGFAFVLAACDLGDKNMWQTGAANRFRNTKFAPELQEVLPDSAASLLFAETQAGIERKLSPDSSWLQRSPDSLLAGYSFKHGGEYVIDKFNLLGGKDGERDLKPLKVWWHNEYGSWYAGTKKHAMPLRYYLKNDDSVKGFGGFKIIGNIHSTPELLEAENAGN